MVVSRKRFSQSPLDIPKTDRSLFCCSRGVSSLSGEVDINVQLLAEDPSFALLYVASLSEDTSYSTVSTFEMRSLA